jgi:hypothetical protein
VNLDVLPLEVPAGTRPRVGTAMGRSDKEGHEPQTGVD